MPASIKMAREFGEDLTVLFVESQGADAPEMEKFAWGQKWMGTRSLWVTGGDSPCDTGADGLPNFALISNTGEILLMGNPLAMHSQIHDAVTAEIEKSLAAPEGSPKALAKAWKAFAKGEYAKALLEARSVAEKGGADGEEATSTAGQFVARVQAKFDRAQWMLDNGYLIEAKALLDALTGATKGVDDFAAKRTELEGRFAAEELKPEMEAAKAFAKLEEKLQEGGFDDKLVKRLEKFVKANGDSMVGKRAAHLLSLTQ